MILNWKHKGLEHFAKTSNKSGILPAHEKRLKVILQRLNAAVNAEDMNTPGMDFHHLSGKLKGYYSVSVNGNWRIIFRFSSEHAFDVNYIDYH